MKKRTKNARLSGADETPSTSLITTRNWLGCGVPVFKNEIDVKLMWKSIIFDRLVVGVCKEWFIRVPCLVGVQGASVKTLVSTL